MHASRVVEYSEQKDRSTDTQHMKLLVLTPFYSPTVSGSTNLIRDVVEHHVNQGDRVDVLTYEQGNPTDYRAFDRRQVYRIYRIPSRSLHGLSSLDMITHGLRLSHRKKYNLVLSAVAYPMAIIALVIRRITGIPYAIYSHGEDVTAVAGSWPKATLLQCGLRSSAAIMVNSSFTADEVAALGIPRSHIQVVHPWINLDAFSAVETKKVEQLRARLGLIGKRIILTVARLERRKGHDMVIRALPAVLARVPNAHYVIVGQGDPGMLRQLAGDLGVQEHVTFVDYATDDELASMYALCDVFVMASRRDTSVGRTEGFGMVYLEAGAACRPVVAGSHGGCPDAVVDGRTGVLVDPLAPGEIADAVLRFLCDSASAMAAGVAGRERAEALAKPVQLSKVASRLRELWVP